MESTSKMIACDELKVNFNEKKEQHYKVYKRRWFMLTMFILFSMFSAAQWNQYTIINNLVSKYYNVHIYAVDWTYECFLLAYILFIIPALWILNKLGLRRSFITMNILMAVGAWIKLYAVSPNKFYVLIIGQVFQSLSQIVIFGMAARLAATWFGANEISLAGALALFGDVVGAALGNVMPTRFVENTEDTDEIGRGMFKLNLLYTSFITVFLISSIFFFQCKPPSPPSHAQVFLNRLNKKKTYNSVKLILSTPSYILFIVCYSLNIGSLFGSSPIINENYKIYFSGHIEYAGTAVFIMYITGIFALFCSGYILDQKKFYKTMTMITSFGCTVCMIMYTTFLLVGNIYLIYAVCAVQGFFWISFYSSGVQMGIELSYPVTEDISAGLMLLFSHIHAFIIAHIEGYLIRYVGPLEANLALCVLLLFSTVLATCIPPHTKRKEVEEIYLKNKDTILLFS